MIAFCGVVQPKSLLNDFWVFMNVASPYTYFVQNLVSIVLHKKPVICSSKELNYFQPPENMTCGAYMKTFLSYSSGYIANPDATSDCAYCIYSVGDDYLKHISASYSNLWRNFGIFFIYIFFNLFAMVFFYYWLHVRGVSFLNPAKLMKILKRKKN